MWEGIFDLQAKANFISTVLIALYRPGGGKDRAPGIPRPKSLIGKPLNKEEASPPARPLQKKITSTAIPQTPPSSVVSGCHAEMQLEIDPRDLQCILSTTGQ